MNKRSIKDLVHGWWLESLLRQIGCYLLSFASKEIMIDQERELLHECRVADHPSDLGIEFSWI